MNELYVFLLTLVVVFAKASSESVLGCGGFVKSHVPIDFSKVEVKLLTKQGILKDKINCAPTNGYYFVPLYDKGEYTLELEPPPGWSFSPTKVDLVVDGISDLCSKSKDIDFVFKGFGITGQVETLGAQEGPSGIKVELKSGSEMRETVTGPNGSFFFTPVYPGSYLVRITDSKSKIFKESINVVVKEGNTELEPHSLIVQGYEVSGLVQNEGNSIKDAIVVLYAPGAGDVKVDGCEKGQLPGISSKDNPVCYVKTDDNGVFRFSTVPFGKYYVAPFYNGQNILYQPNSVQFEVRHQSVALAEVFEIIGFSVSGRILKSANGAPVVRAKLYLNGKEAGQSGLDGVYKLQKLKAGTYNLKAMVHGFQFGEITLKLNPNVKQIPDLVPEAYGVCGKVVSEKSHTVTFAKIGSTKFVSVQSDRASGEFCEYLPPGKYQVQVQVDGQDLQKGLQFFPKVLEVEVNAEQIASIVFSQLKATVTGEIECLQKKDCTNLQVIMRLSGEAPEKNILIAVNDNKFRISDINPGIYEIFLSNNQFCWKNSKQTINVNSVSIKVPSFVQTGYNVAFVSSHDTEVVYKTPTEPLETSIKIPKGRLSYCFNKSGTYNFILKGCHSYETHSIQYSTDAQQSEIVLNALKHTITLIIEADQKHADVSAVTNIGGMKSVTGALPFANGGYTLELLLSPSEDAVIVPQSDVLYFLPPILKISGDGDCKHLGAMFKAVKGVVFQGKVLPALADVLVTIESDNSDALIAYTDKNGVYKFPPLQDTKNYKISAKKDSFVLVGPNDNGDFLAHKLAEIVIEVVDEVNTMPLQGTLLSLSGGDSYRSNLQTNKDGKIAFHSLSPGEYFLRPMMKEYNFEPNSKIIKVVEGQITNVQLVGKRIAYSAFGEVTSLNSEPEENMVVAAIGTENCSHFSEESTSESNGQFRIRGLQPFCSYDISVKHTTNERNAFERSAPKQIHVQLVNSDIKNLHFFIFHSVSNTDLLVKVFAENPEHYKSLRLKVVRETPTVAVVYTGRVEQAPLGPNDRNQGVLVQVPPIPLDGRRYSVHLESSLNNKLEPEAEVFVANSSFKYVEIHFVVRSSVVEQDIKQTSVLTLIFIFVVICVVYNIDKVSRLIRENCGSYISDLMNTVTKKAAIHDYSVDNDDIDQIVQSINAVKKRPTKRRLE